MKFAAYKYPRVRLFGLLTSLFSHVTRLIRAPNVACPAVVKHLDTILLPELHSQYWVNRFHRAQRDCSSTLNIIRPLQMHPLTFLSALQSY